jgi:transposase
MPRMLISDQLWPKLYQILIVNCIYKTEGLRLTVERILYKLRTGCPWRDIPDYFGKWNSIYKRFNDWSLQEKLKKVFFCYQKNMIMNGLL